MDQRTVTFKLNEKPARLRSDESKLGLLKDDIVTLKLSNYGGICFICATYYTNETVTIVSQNYVLNDNKTQ